MMRRRADDDGEGNSAVAGGGPGAAWWRPAPPSLPSQSQQAPVRSINTSHSLSFDGLQMTPGGDSPFSTGHAVFFALDTPMTPEGSPPADSPARLPRTDHSSSSNSNSSTHRSGLAAFVRLNVVQRILSAAVLVPLVTTFLWRSPAFATATFCAFVTSLCAYEYAWLAHRIHVRIVEKAAKFAHLEGSLSPTAAARSSTTRAHPHHSQDAENSSSNNDPGNRRERSGNRSSHSTRNESMTDDVVCKSGSPRQESQVDHELSPTSSSRSSLHNGDSNYRNSTSSKIPPPPLSPATVSPEVNTRPPLSSPTAASRAVVDGDILLLDVNVSQCAISPLAAKYFSGNEWLAALVLSCFSTSVMSTAFLLAAPWIPELETTELYRLRWFYAVATDYVAGLSAFFTPNWKYAVICLVEKTVFTLLTLHSTICPINQFGCGLSMEPAQVFLSGVVLILLFRLQTRRKDGGAAAATTNALAMFLHIVLDMLGFLYIVGSLSVIVAFVDDEQLEAYRKLLIVLLYVVWASDTGAYVTGKLLAALHYKYYNPLAAHLSKNKDYEGTLGAILFGVAAMHFASDLLDVQGSTIAKVTFTVLAVVAGRIGDLFESLLKRAAGVKDSGKLIPGHGGMLDRIDALMFASLVFARYYAMIVVPNMSGTTTPQT